MNHPIVSFIGAGNMARSLAGGLLANGWEKRALLLSDPDPAQRRAVEEAMGLTAIADNHLVAAGADVVVLAVKPQVLRAVARGVAPTVQKKRPLILSIAAGIRIADLARWLGGDLPIVRAMPNTPALVGAGSAGLFANPLTSQPQRDLAESVLRAVGTVVWLQDEDLLDVVTALSGSGPAYFFLVMEALEKAAIELGLDRGTARLLAVETGYGAAKMALEGHEDPALLRARVTSPGGTTERAIKLLQQGGLEDLFRQALAGAAERSHELADLFGKD